MDKIYEKKSDKLLINPRNFLKLSDNSFFNFLTFSYDSYEKMISSNHIIEYKLHSTLANKFSKVIEDFRLKYRNELELQEYYFKYDSIKKRKFENSGKKK